MFTKNGKLDKRVKTNKYYKADGTPDMRCAFMDAAELFGKLIQMFHKKSQMTSGYLDVGVKLIRIRL